MDCDNSALKGGEMGPQPNMGIDKAQTSIGKHKRIRHQKMKQSAHACLTQCLRTFAKEENTVEAAPTEKSSKYHCQTGQLG